ncbi:MAG: cupin domain-containing protein [Chitinophagaceae bacterium]|nr:MAG: cupin domain-containing protein [Chitinophagaceae bacterium]
MDFYVNALKNIAFEDKQTDDEERFGIYRIPTDSGCVEIVKLYPDTYYKPHIHDRANAKFIFLQGKGKVLLDDKAFPFKEGDIFEAPAGVKHGFELTEESIFISVQSHPIQDRSTGEIDIRYE